MSCVKHLKTFQNFNLESIHHFSKPYLEFTIPKHKSNNNDQTIKYINPLTHVSNSSLQISLLSQNSTLKFSSKVNFVYSFLVENSFIRYSKQTLKKPNLVLTQAPLYKMDDISPVTSNRDRGNVYTSSNFLQNKSY